VLEDDVPPLVSMVVTTNIALNRTSERIPAHPRISTVGSRSQCQSNVLQSTMIVASGE
jgi:hypothetical protein